MSWQSYVDTNLVGTGKVSKAAIIGLADKNVWAKSADLNISADELKALATAFDDTDKVQGTGLRVSEKKYFTILINKEKGEESVQLKQGLDGACICKTSRAIILGVYIAPIQQSECFSIVYSLAQYLTSQGY